MPVSSGFASGETTSVKLGNERALPAGELLPGSNCSGGLASASVSGPFSASRRSFQEFVALVWVTEIVLIFSTLKKSLFNQRSGLVSTSDKASETTATSL